MGLAPGERPLGSAAVSLLGPLYAGALPAFLIAIRHEGHGPRSWAGTALVFMPLVITWVCDSAAMFVGQRSGYIGVRVERGASARAIRGLVLRQGMTPAIAGVGAGLLASVAIGRVIESMLFGVSSRDLLTYAIVTLLIVASALAACLFPARRAAAVDAVVALRAE